MDHPHYTYSALPDRPSWRWPGDAGLALAVVVLLETVETSPEAPDPPTPAAGVGPRPQPNYAMLAHREYGHRVGVFRLLDVLRQHRIRPSVAMDALTAEEYPFLVEHCLERGAELIGHGVSANRTITSAMTLAEETHYVDQSLKRLFAATGVEPSGWLSPDYRESSRTPAVVAAAGMRYLCDWGNDEQPYRMHVPKGQLCAIPTAVEFDDAHAFWTRRMTPQSYSTALISACQTLREESAQAPRSLVVVLRPWLSGQPFRIGAVDHALGAVVAAGGVWAASTGDMAEAFMGRA